MCLVRPTVTNPVGEMKTLFEEDKIGLLADENPNDMADKIVALIQNPELRENLGRNARLVAETKLSWDITIDRLEQVYIDTMLRFHKKQQDG
jgi:glycosyltransferase involved in cell wall biosynthesis